MMTEVELPASVVVQRTTGIVTHLPSGETHEISAPGVMLDRAGFDEGLAEAAADAGAQVWTRTRALGLFGDDLVAVDRDGERGTIMAKVIVGADGPRSLIGRAVGLVNEAFVVAKQLRVRLKTPLSASHVYFDPSFYGGYGWLFPRQETANLGVGVAADRKDCLDDALGRLEELAEENGLIEPGAAVFHTGGVIPVGGGVGGARSGMVLLAGDAAGQTHPVTGAGVHPAVSCGAMAGRAAARFSTSGDERDLARYETEWQALWKSVLDRGARRREELLRRWDSDLEAAVRRCWVTFPDYHVDS
jgi:flavin-dependent dehydrogenase